jgi:hypothetical protein
MERHNRSAAAIGQRRFVRPWMRDSVRFTAPARILRSLQARRSEKFVHRPATRLIYYDHEYEQGVSRRLRALELG